QGLAAKRADGTAIRIAAQRAARHTQRAGPQPAPGDRAMGDPFSVREGSCGLTRLASVLRLVIDSREVPGLREAGADELLDCRPEVGPACICERAAALAVLTHFRSDEAVFDLSDDSRKPDCSTTCSTPAA